MLGDAALGVDRVVAQPDHRHAAVARQRLGDDAGRVGEVDQRGLRRQLAHIAGDVEHTGTVRSALANPPTPVVSWPIR